MRIVWKRYLIGSDVEDVIVRTDDDGGNSKVLEGELPDRSSIKRVPIVIEVSCDGNDDVINDARTALQKIDKVLEEQLGA